MVLSYAVVEAAGGKISFVRSGPISDLRLQRPVSAVTSAGTEAVFGSIDPRGLWQSVNATADFPWSAGVMRDMYSQAAGQEVDGVIAIDVPGLAALLRVTGPVQVPGLSRPLSVGNAAEVLQHDLYQY